MEGKITNDGDLEIKRGGQYKAVKCPYIRDREVITVAVHGVVGNEYFNEGCGDFCAKFEEPIYDKRKPFPREHIRKCFNSGLKIPMVSASIEICGNQTLMFDKFVDFRNHEEST